jgi:hypothetical protein
LKRVWQSFLVLILSLSGALANGPGVPFRAGEILRFDVKFGYFKVGQGSMSVLGIEQVRGRAAWHTEFKLKGSALGLKVDDHFQSWFEVSTFDSLTFRKRLQEVGNEREYHYEIYPEKTTYQRQGQGHLELASVEHPLDE